MAGSKTYLTVSVSSDERATEQFEAAMRGEPQGHWLAFETVELLWSTLSPERWSIVQALVGSVGMTPAEIADRLRRPPDEVLRDLERLLSAGVVDFEDGLYVFDYDGIHVDFVLAAA